MTRQGRLLLSKRVSSGATLSDVARALNPGTKLTPAKIQIVWAWENGKIVINPKRVRAVSEAYGIDFDDLVYEMMMDYAAKIRRDNAKISCEPAVSATNERIDQEEEIAPGVAIGL